MIKIVKLKHLISRDGMKYSHVYCPVCDSYNLIEKSRAITCEHFVKNNKKYAMFEG